MTEAQLSNPIPLNKGLLITGATLVSLGGVLAGAGIGCVTYALVVAAREWSHRLPVPPNEIARRKLMQARSAGGAAAQAWRGGGGVAPVE